MGSKACMTRLQKEYRAILKVRAPGAPYADDQSPLPGSLPIRALLGE